MKGGIPGRGPCFGFQESEEIKELAQPNDQLNGRQDNTHVKRGDKIGGNEHRSVDGESSKTIVP